MTCIVGIEDKGDIYIGADSAGIDIDSLSICTRADEKVFITESGEFIIGFSGSFRVGQLMRYAIDLPEQSQKKDDMAYMVTDFVDAIRFAQHNRGSLKKESELEELPAALLVGYKSKLYVIENDFQVGLPIENYAAVGCGAQIALGAMYALKNSNISPTNKLEIALMAASEYSVGVRPPFIVLKLAKDSW